MPNIRQRTADISAVIDPPEIDDDAFVEEGNGWVNDRSLPTEFGGRAPQPAFRSLASTGYRHVTEWDSYEHLLNDIRSVGLTGDANVPQKDERGRWFRVVAESTGKLFVENGQVVVAKRRVRRYVALSLADARSKMSNQREIDAGTAYSWDHWNGSTWIRRGQKPEDDPGLVIYTKQRDEETFTEPLPEHDQVEYRRSAAARAGAIVPGAGDPGLAPPPPELAAQGAPGKGGM